VKTKVISFDCYGTLIDWESGILDCFHALTRAKGITLRDDQILQAYSEIEPSVQAGPYRKYRDVLHEVTVRFAARFGLRLEGSDADRLLESLISWKPFPDTLPALRRLKERFQLAIVSNIDDDLFAGTARSLQVPFDYVVTAEQVRSYKPGKAHFEELLKRTGADISEHLHAAESLFHDILPTHQMGIPNIWVRRSHATIVTTASPKVRETPRWTVEDLHGLVEFMDRSGVTPAGSAPL
jgi:2-haloacid dehalogenase